MEEVGHCIFKYGLHQNMSGLANLRTLPIHSSHKPARDRAYLTDAVSQPCELHALTFTGSAEVQMKIKSLQCVRQWGKEY